MKKIYIITTGSYSGYSIKAVFSTKELAEAALTHFEDHNDIEEWDVDFYDLKTIPEGKTAWRCQKTSRKSLDRVYQTDGFGFKESFEVGQNDYYGTLVIMSVWARDKDHAEKLFQERIQLALRTGELKPGVFE